MCVERVRERESERDRKGGWKGRQPASKQAAEPKGRSCWDWRLPKVRGIREDIQPNKQDRAARRVTEKRWVTEARGWR